MIGFWGGYLTSLSSSVDTCPLGLLKGPRLLADKEDPGPRPLHNLIRHNWTARSICIWCTFSRCHHYLLPALTQSAKSRRCLRISTNPGRVSSAPNGLP